MYKEFETRTSYQYLQKVIDSLNEPISLLGGWAVFFHVNGRFEKAQGRPYLGSRDIDLGFTLGKDPTGSALAQAIKALKEKLGFKPLSFRLMKDIHTETGEEIKKGEMVPAHFIFPMYVDLIVDVIPKNFKETFGFNPIDEPLLKFVFEKGEHTFLKEFGKKLLVPKPELLLAMKINSLPNRDREHKRIKDICDIFALAWYSGLNPENAGLHRYVSNKCLKDSSVLISKEDCLKAGAQLGHDAQELRRAFDAILSH
ncbi:nucleotidyl transferase AbiEii/AbiGii toxin family protein [Candidatus Woesearchaeota archaeon]|nr:nucleotidyl transferase AbiEii/AbiGii toxin family protein [Candidatus Woesearchaeota archaeon]